MISEEPRNTGLPGFSGNTIGPLARFFGREVGGLDRLEGDNGAQSSLVFRVGPQGALRLSGAGAGWGAGAFILRWRTC